jgi:hypothetical protein
MWDAVVALQVAVEGDGDQRLDRRRPVSVRGEGGTVAARTFKIGGSTAYVALAAAARA